MARPPKKDWSRWIGLGLYVGTAGNPEINEEKIASDLYSSHFNAISLHLPSPWDNEGHYPWMFDPVSKVYLLNKPNFDWYQHLETLLDRLAYYWIGIEMSFFDSYFEEKWIDDQPIAYHPFRNNNVHKNIGSKEDVKWFYDGWVPGRGFLWISWEDVSNYVFKNYKAIPPLGPPVIDYIKRVMSIVKKIRSKYPGCRIRYKSYNETLAFMEMNSQGELVANASRSRGDRAEIQSYVRDLWKDYIPEEQPKAVGYIDYMALYQGKPHIPTLAEATKWIERFGLNLEVHYGYTKEICQQMLAAGIRQNTLFSTDGKKEPPEVHYGTGDSPYFKDLKGVESLKLRNVDYKLWARYKGPRAWKIGNMMWNWNEFFPLMAQIF